MATAIDIGLLFLFTDKLGLYYLFSQTLSFCISLVFGFLFQKYITFQSTTGNNIKQLFLFFLFQIVGLLINLLILKISVDIFHIHYMI
jgi:dolichol-phosphate mannosyltransferase